MAKLSNLVNTSLNKEVIKIQGVAIPVIFTMRSFPFVEQAYGKQYLFFEKELNNMMSNKNQTMGHKETKLMYALVYAMVRTGGTECTLSEIEGSISFSDLPDIFEKVMGIFNNQTFQKTDMERIKTAKKS